MESIESHIEKDKDILNDPTTSAQQRRHAEVELYDLEQYVVHHKEEIESGDHHDPTSLEIHCDLHPEAPECLIYED